MIFSWSVSVTVEASFSVIREKRCTADCLCDESKMYRGRIPSRYSGRFLRCWLPRALPPPQPAPTRPRALPRAYQLPLAWQRGRPSLATTANRVIRIPEAEPATNTARDLAGISVLLPRTHAPHPHSCAESVTLPAVAIARS